MILSRAEEYVRGAITLSSPPVIYDRLMTVVNDPRSGCVEVGQVISEDPNLAARILLVVNSAFYSLPWRVDSISAAVQVIGTSQIRDLALATSVLSLFKGVSKNVLAVDPFRRHGLACGVIARVIASRMGGVNIERYLVGGLLHDIGRFVIATRSGADLAKAMAAAREDGKDLHSCEREHLGCTHAQVGGALLERWNFPPAVREMVTFHHQPQRATLFPVETAVIHVADVMAHGLSLGRSGQPRVPALEPRAWSRLGIDPAGIPGLLEEASVQVRAAEVLLPPDGDGV